MSRTKFARHHGMAPKFALVLVVCFSLLGAFAALPAFTGHTNYWVGAEWADYNDAANWRVDDPDTAATVAPGANDLIYLDGNTTYKFDLGGLSKTIAIISSNATNGYYGGEGTINVTNGALTIRDTFGSGTKLNVWDGGTVTFGSGISETL